MTTEPIRHELRGLEGSEPMAFLAAVGLLRVAASRAPEARLQWFRDGTWLAALHLPPGLDPVEVVVDDLERWRGGHPALGFAEGADRKTQDLKAPPEEFRELMREVRDDPEAASFVAAYATGVAVDGTGQTKPTSLHLCAGQQRFLDAIFSLRDQTTREDVAEALHGPWVGRPGPKDPRWRSASDRQRALLSFDPGKKRNNPTVAGAAWLAFQAMPLFPVVPIGARAATTGFMGFGKRQQFSWPLWSETLSLDSVRTLLGTPGMAQTSAGWRAARGVVQVFESAVSRDANGLGNFAAADPR